MKKYFYIFILMVVISLSSYAQNRISINSDPSVKFMKFYPNPAVSVINFEFQKDYNKSFSFQLYNFIGKKILDLKSVTQIMNIPLTDFYRGVYIYQLRDKSGKIIESGKFQVIK
ncbi:MAG: T9SS type A sorting domain-containing protein [Ginsengibacter sp.]